MKVFIAAPLFNEMERDNNRSIKELLLRLGFSVFLAQDDVGLSYEMIESKETKSGLREKIFRADVNGVRDCDILLLLLDGRVPDEGACVELGMAHAMGKICIAYKTDSRAMDVNGDNNIMIDGTLSFGVTTTLAALEDTLRQARLLEKCG